MGCVVVFNILALESAGAARSQENSLNRAAASAEFYLAKQENAYRGFLLSNDPYYAERLDAHRAKFHDAIEALRKDIPADRAAPLDKALRANAAWYENVVEAGKTLVSQGRGQEAEDMVGPSGSADAFIGPIEDALEELKASNEVALAASRKAQQDAAQAAMIAVIIGLAAALLLAVGVGLAVRGAIAGPTQAMIDHMKRLMAGDTAIQVKGLERKDEFGQMAQAVSAFRDNAVEKVRLEAEAAAHRETAKNQRMAVEAEKARIAEEDGVAMRALAEGLAAMSSGDLTHRMTVEVAPRSEQLKTDFNQAIAQLQKTVSVVVDNVSAIRSGAGEISQAADDLSRRTEQQAASLEETAAALDEITVTVNKTAGGARQASDVVGSAKGDAETSGLVMSDAVQAMRAIEQSSSQISQIIGVIDEIAFQTNLLALNAGVEAARAGDAGRGFAVVASEVRALAQRSAQAAKEIKALISASTGQVGTGVKLVAETGQALQRIVARVAEIDALVSEIAASAQEQAVGLAQVNTAVNQMDQVTQQNAAMVEQSTAASHSLAQEAEALQASVARFKTGQAGRGARETSQHRSVGKAAPQAILASAETAERAGALGRP
ncbi:hypothetical protein LTR94_024449, partial [Friedmanniomyces endolithicus]